VSDGYFHNGKYHPIDRRGNPDMSTRVEGVPVLRWLLLIILAGILAVVVVTHIGG
jgi:hypothetical protein